MPGHPSRPAHAIWTCQPSWQRFLPLLARVGGIFRSATQPEAVLGVVGSGGWHGGYLSGQSGVPYPFPRPTQGKQGGEADRVC